MCNSKGSNSRSMTNLYEYQAKVLAKQRIAKASCTGLKRSRCSSSKSVRFHGTVKVALKKVSPSELESAWYSPVEYKSFKAEGRHSLKAVKSSLKGDTAAYDASQHCLRGLENCISVEQYKERQGQKATVVKGVLNQQLIQRLLGVQDSDNLAQVSQQLSQEARERALMLAAFDSQCNPSKASS